MGLLKNPGIHAELRSGLPLFLYSHTWVLYHTFSEIAIGFRKIFFVFCYGEERIERLDREGTGTISNAEVPCPLTLSPTSLAGLRRK